MLNIKEMCEKFKITAPTLLKWRKLGLPCIKIDRKIYFEKEKVMEWLIIYKERGNENGITK